MDDPIFGDTGPGIDIAGDCVDVAEAILDFQAVFENAFPGCTFSHDYM